MRLDQRCAVPRGCGCQIFGLTTRWRLLARVAVAHGRGVGSMTRAGVDRAYRVHSTLTSVHPYVAFDLSENLTVLGRGEMAESVVRTEGLGQSGRVPHRQRAVDGGREDSGWPAGGRGSSRRRGGVSRVRALLEGSRELCFAVGHAVGRAGVRQDGRDAETGRAWRPASGWSMLTRTSG